MKLVAPLLVAIYCSALVSPVNALPVTLGYTKVFNLAVGSHHNVAVDQKIDALGNTYLLSETYSGAYRQLNLTKFDPNGIQMLNVPITIDGYSQFIKIGSSGSIYICGSTRGMAIADWDTLVIKVSPTGVVQWAQSFDSGDKLEDAPLDLWEAADSSIRLLLDAGRASGNALRLSVTPRTGSRRPTLLSIPDLNLSKASSLAMVTSSSRGTRDLLPTYKNRVRTSCPDLAPQVLPLVRSPLITASPPTHQGDSTSQKRSLIPAQLPHRPC